MLVAVRQKWRLFMEKEKEKPRRRNEIFKQTIFNCFNKEMEVQTKEFIKKNPD